MRPPEKDLESAVQIYPEEKKKMEHARSWDNVLMIDK